MKNKKNNDLIGLITYEKLIAARRLINAAAKKSARTTREIFIIAVTKTHPPSTIQSANILPKPPAAAIPLEFIPQAT